jgi:hypothetical protein
LNKPGRLKTKTFSENDNRVYTKILTLPVRNSPVPQLSESSPRF